jgi:hypothetical protein
VGTFSASGVYVPVADAAVILNTGYLVYVACSLRPLVSALRQNASAAIAKNILNSFNTGNDGNPQFSQNINRESGDVADKQFVDDIQGGVLNTLHPAIKDVVQRAVVQSYRDTTRNPSNVLACPYKGDLSKLLNGSEFSWDGLSALQNPACNPMGARLLAGELEDRRVANAVNNYMTELQWGQGILPLKKLDANGVPITVTPGQVILSQANQALQSGFLETENASDIGQMVNALFAGMGAQAISSADGLVGMTQSIGGAPAYLDQVTAAASAAARGAVVNTAITILNSARATQRAYLANLQKIARSLIDAINALQVTEAGCWDHIITNACTAGSLKVTAGVTTCTDPAGNNLRIATSTAFSFAVKSTQISPLAQATAPQITAAQSAIVAIDRLIAGVTNTTSLSAQSLAIQQLDQLTRSNGFPKSSDVAAAATQASSVDQTMQTLITTTISNWQGIDSNGNQTLPWNNATPATAINPGIGWCNYNNPATIGIWRGIWKI